MLENLESTTWVPAFVKDKSFANWISNAHGWNTSRNRYWGLPIPLWVSDDYEEIVCVGSVAELLELSGFTGQLDGIHRDKIDDLTIPSKQGKGLLRRVDEVFDCWFESGCMPYASCHFPFDTSDDFHGGLFPADFIAEGLDQTRGWFYTLTVLGNKLFQTSPFRNCNVNGLVLAENGKTMSTSLKNYPDPAAVINSYGSDALRLCPINSTVVRAEPMRFKEFGAKEVVSKFLLPLWNGTRFFCEQINMFKKTTGSDFIAQSLATGNGMSNIMDRWILADCQSMLRFIDEEMRCYRLYTVVLRLLQVTDDLTDWYIRFDRKRLKGVARLGINDIEAALNTLCEVLFTLVRALTPFMPFISEHVYGLLKPFLGDALSAFQHTRSVHFLPFPAVQETLLDDTIERQVGSMQKVIQLARTARERKNVSLKTPLLSLVVVADRQLLSDVESLQSYVKEEINVRELVLTSDVQRYNILLEARVDWPTLGKKLKRDAQVVRREPRNLSQEQLTRYLQEKKMTIDGIELKENEMTVVRVLEKLGPSDGDGPLYEVAFSDDIAILLDVASHPELLDEGLIRDIVNRVQRMRKKARLMPTDDIRMKYGIVSNPENVAIDAMVSSRQPLFETCLRDRLELLPLVGSVGGSPILQEEHNLSSVTLMLRLAHI